MRKPDFLQLTYQDDVVQLLAIVADLVNVNRIPLVMYNFRHHLQHSNAWSSYEFKLPWSAGVFQ